MGYMMVLGTCFGCRALFHFNASLVPSFKGEPICASCIRKVNAKRAELGEPLWPVPEGAYEPEIEAVWSEPSARSCTEIVPEVTVAPTGSARVKSINTAKTSNGSLKYVPGMALSPPANNPGTPS